MSPSASGAPEAPSLKSAADAALFTGVFLLYLCFGHGDIAWLDGGHLTAAAAELGVPHATGFPLFVVFGYMATLIPVGTVAFKVALLSAASIAGATTLIQHIARRHGARAWEACLGALLFPLTFQVWINGQLQEVYALNGLWIMGLAWCLWRSEPAYRRGLLITGLGLGSHATFVLSAAAMWFVVLIGKRRVVHVLRQSPFLVVGGLIVCFLPVAASRDLWMNWGGGEVATLSGFWDHLTAQGIRDSFAGEMGSQSHLLFQASQWGSSAGGPLFPVLVGLVVVSGAWVKSRGLWLGIGLVLLTDLLFSVFINPMGQADLQTGIPGALMLSLGVAVALGQLPNTRTLGRVSLRPVTLGVLILLVVIQGAERWDDRPADDRAGTHGRLALTHLLPDATVFATGDNIPGQFLYLQAVEGLRRDVLTLVTPHVADGASTAHAYRKAGRALPASFEQVSPGAGLWGRVDALIRADIFDRPVYWQLGMAGMDARVRPNLRPRGTLHRLRTGSSQACPMGEGLQALENRLTKFGPAGFRTRRQLSETLRLNASWCLFVPGTMARANAQRLVDRAIKLDDTNVRALTLAGTLLAWEGQRASAARYFERSLRLDPTYERAGTLLGKYAD